MLWNLHLYRMVTGSKSVQALVFYICEDRFPFKNLHSAFKYTNLVRSFFLYAISVWMRSYNEE